MVTSIQFDAAVLLSQVARWREMGNRFREGGAPSDPTGLIVVLVAVGVLAPALWLLSKFFTRDGQRPFHGPVRLFLQLCRAHRLNLRESWLLWRLARAHGLRQPAELFVNANRFAASNIPATISRRRNELGALRLRLFEPHQPAATPSQ